MVEIHEPLRILFAIEATQAALTSIMERNPGIKALVLNRWVQLAAIDPETGAISVFESGAFAPYEPEGLPLPVAATSEQWYSGWRDHLEFAEIAPAGQRQG
jgi:hypothetical protein